MAKFLKLSLACMAALSCASGFPARAKPDETPAYAITARIAGADGGWDYANVDPQLNRLFVSRSNAVMAMDLATGQVWPQWARAQTAHQVLVLDAGREILQTDGGTDQARFLDAMTGAVITEVPVGKKPDAALFDPSTGLAVVMNGLDGTLSLLDPGTHRLVGSIVVGGGLEFGVADGKGRLFINIEDRNEIAVVDMRRRRVTRRIALTGCEGPTGLALIADGQRLLSSCANRVAVVTDPVAGRVTQALPIGGDPDAVLYDARRGLAFIPCGKDGVLAVIAAARPEAIRGLGSIPTAVSAKTGALDPRTGKIYLPAADLLPAAPGAKRGRPEPGTFRVLVLTPAVPAN